MSITGIKNAAVSLQQSPAAMLMADMSIRFLSAEYIDKREKKIKNISSTPKREKLKNIFSVVNKRVDVNANVSFFVRLNAIKYTIISEDIP